MDYVYLLDQNSAALPLKRIECQNEEKELQILLERNLHLLPASQIRPDKELRWLIVKREMPVVNPASGEASWSIDFLLLDQDAVPTLVECKRKNDPRSKSEVVGQMLKYAANGRYYWTAAEFTDSTRKTAGGDLKLEEALNKLAHAEASDEDFFARAEENLKRSRMRLIFFLEESSPELRTVVEYLNGQFKETEVLLVEARQYLHGESRIVIPSVFGFTEEARAAKKEATAEARRTSRVLGELAFWNSLEATLPSEQADQIRDFFAEALQLRTGHLSWLTGGVFKMPDLIPRHTLFGIHRSGTLELHLCNWVPSQLPGDTLKKTEARRILRSAMEATFDISQAEQETKKFRLMKPEQWLPRKEEFLQMLKDLDQLCASKTADCEMTELLPTA